jgi:hypothetical protein
MLRPIAASAIPTRVPALSSNTGLAVRSRQAITWRKAISTIQKPPAGGDIGEEECKKKAGCKEADAAHGEEKADEKAQMEDDDPMALLKKLLEKMLGQQGGEASQAPALQDAFSIYSDDGN